MHIRLKITLISTFIISLLLSLTCGLIYYFSYTTRLKNIKNRLTNESYTVSKMLSRPGEFNRKLMDLINATTVPLIKDKSIMVFSFDEKVVLYSYRENGSSAMEIGTRELERSKMNILSYFDQGNKDMVAYNDKANHTIIFVAAYDWSGKENLKHLGLLLVLSVIAGSVISFITGYYFSRKLLLPIRKIADEVNTISAQSLAHRIKSGNADDDWNYLIDTLNELLNRLQESFEIQRRFISSASHELSTPLTAISSQLEVSLQRERRPEEYKEIMQSVYQDVRQLGKLTQTLLKFATVSGNTGGIELNLIRIDEVLLLLPEEIVKLDKGYRVKFIFDELPEDEKMLLVFGNEELLFTAFINIVSNACKYSSDQLATVRLVINNTNVIIAIEDNGKGISESELQNIFQPFYRTEDSRQITGSGVGLPLVKRIIKLHNGQINVTSVLNKGTIFSVILPFTGQSAGS